MSGPNPFVVFLAEKKESLDKLLSDYISTLADNPHIPQQLKEGMVYAAQGEGKRLRPALVLLGWDSCRDWFDQENSLHRYAEEWFYRAALAVELIHTYSLVHDDLPAMDNDSLRRGRPTCHVRFDEATAVLIGDALLNQAFEILQVYGDTKSMEPGKKLEWLEGMFRSTKLLAAAAGPEGMIGGQILDMAGENKTLSLDELKRIHLLKTGKLIQASLNLLPAFYGDAVLIDSLNRYGETVGLLYQVVDDILDVTATPESMGKTGTDTKNKKTTFVLHMGVEGSIAYAEKLTQEAIQSVVAMGKKSGKPGLSSDTVARLVGFGEYVFQRCLS